MRNVLVHQYFGIDLNMVWDTVTTDIPILKENIKKILENEEKSRDGELFSDGKI
ncbi:MAG: DUF86 domain-containing protein [Desulfococcaceae bacterium]